MPFINGFLLVLCLFVAGFILCLVGNSIAWITYALKDAVRAMSLRASAKKYASLFEADLLEEIASRLKAEATEENEAGRKEILQKYATTDQRFVDGLLQTTMRLLESVRVETVEQDVERRVNLFFFQSRVKYDVKQIMVAGMPIGKMFKVQKKSGAVLRIDRLANVVSGFRMGIVPEEVLKSMPKSDKLIAERGTV